MPQVHDLPMSDEAFADFTDTIKLFEAKGTPRHEAINKIITDGLKPHAKKLAEARAFAAKQAEQAQG